MCCHCASRRVLIARVIDAVKLGAPVPANAARVAQIPNPVPRDLACAKRFETGFTQTTKPRVVGNDKLRRFETWVMAKLIIDFFGRSHVYLLWAEYDVKKMGLPLCYSLGSLSRMADSRVSRFHSRFHHYSLWVTRPDKERRLLYVAITQAKRDLYLCSNEKACHGKLLRKKYYLLFANRSRTSLDTARKVSKTPTPVCAAPSWH